MQRYFGGAYGCQCSASNLAVYRCVAIVVAAVDKDCVAGAEIRETVFAVGWYIKCYICYPFVSLVALNAFYLKVDEDIAVLYLLL